MRTNIILDEKLIEKGKNILESILKEKWSILLSGNLSGAGIGKEFCY